MKMRATYHARKECGTMETMQIMWVLYWKDVELGIKPFALIAAFNTKESAWKWLYSSGAFTPAQRECISITTVPFRG